MTQPAKANEPSMEEILASIRRIIAEDDAKRDTGWSPAPSAGPQPPASRNPPPPSRMGSEPATRHEQIDAMIADLHAPRPRSYDEEDPDFRELAELARQSVTTPPSPPRTEVPAEPSLPPARVVSPPRPAERASAELQLSPAPPPAGDGQDAALLSQSATTAIDQAFSALSNAVLGQNARSLEDIIREMLRPMLKTWLDDNLPSLVERLVRAEIERVSRGRP